MKRPLLPASSEVVMCRKRAAWVTWLHSPASTALLLTVWLLCLWLLWREVR